MRRKTQHGILGIVLILGASALAACTPPPADTVHQGLSALDAAPSCFAIKHSFPSSADGVYWLDTPQLQAPQQFYCDMTTDGGGWVLIGRGRQGWQFNSAGQGSPATLRNTIGGTAAFTPAVLSTDTINGLVAGGNIAGLPDGIRIRRAADMTGTTWQDVRYHVHDESRWSWGFGGGVVLDSADFDGVNYPLPNSNAVAASTADLAIDDGMFRIFTWPWFDHNSQAGFAYGSSVAGSSASTAYLWTAAGENFAIPFAQVWIRPEFGDANAGFAAIPDTGLAAVTQPALVANVAQAMPWGVTGLLKTADPDPANDSPIFTLAQIGNTIYVGGKFQNVQKGSGGSPTAQSYLAAFDMATGNWISSFRPILDGLVFDLKAAPNGNLLVAGNFTNIGGAANSAGLSEIDPVSGAVISGWKAPVVGKKFAGTRPWVRALDIHGNTLYVVGSFTSIRGGPSLNTVTAGGVARVSLTDGTPDPSWKATVNAIPMDIKASADGARVTIVGRFSTVNSTPALALAVLDPTTAQVVPGLGGYVPNDPVVANDYMQTALDLPQSLVIGGSQHSIQQYRRTDLALERAHTTRYGGDFQALTLLDGTLYASCHCGNWLYSDNNVFPIDHAYSRVAPVSWAMAIDPNSFDVNESFEPQINMSTQYEGPWDLLGDTQHCLWVAGDLVSTWTAKWLGGFARFCPRDATAPSTPSAFAVKTSGATSTLSWKASTDNSGTNPTYEVLRDDRVIATQSTRSFIVPGAGHYFVRAIDTSANRSATTPVIIV